MKAKRYAFRLRSRGDVPADFVLASEAEQEIAQLEAVAEYAQHKLACAANGSNVCICGLTAALEAENEKWKLYGEGRNKLWLAEKEQREAAERECERLREEIANAIQHELSIEQLTIRAEDAELRVSEAEEAIRMMFESASQGDLDYVLYRARKDPAVVRALGRER